MYQAARPYSTIALIGGCSVSLSKQIPLGTVGIVHIHRGLVRGYETESGVAS